MEHCTFGRLAAKAKYENAILADPYGPIVQTKLGTRWRGTEDQAALDQVSVEGDAVGAGGCGAEQQEQRQSDPDYGCLSRGGVASAADFACRWTWVSRPVATSELRYASCRSKLQ